MSKITELINSFKCLESDNSDTTKVETTPEVEVTEPKESTDDTSKGTDKSIEAAKNFDLASLKECLFRIADNQSVEQVSKYKDKLKKLIDKLDDILEK